MVFIPIPFRFLRSFTAEKYGYTETYTWDENRTNKKEEKS